MATFGSVLYNPLPSYKSHVLRADILTTSGSLWFQKKGNHGEHKEKYLQIQSDAIPPQ